MFFAGFKSNPEIFKPMALWPQNWNTIYYAQLFSDEWIPFKRVFLNSILISLGQSIGAVTMTAMAGYVFANHEFRFRKPLFVLAIIIIVIPRQTLAIPLSAWVHVLALSDTAAGVILPGMVSGLGIIFFTQVFRQVPQSYIDTARLSGASEFRVFLTIAPMIGSSFLTFGLIHFILAWHEHLVPLLILSSEMQQTLPLALSSLYASSLRFPYAVLMAGSTVTIIPTAFLMILLYRRFKTSIGDLLVH